MPENGVKTLEELNAEFLKKRQGAELKQQGPAKTEGTSPDPTSKPTTMPSALLNKNPVSKYMRIFKARRGAPQTEDAVSVNIEKLESVALQEVAPAKRKKLVKVVTDILFYLVIAGILIGSAAFALSDSPGKSIFGYRFYNILTASMEPTHRPSDMIIVAMTDAQDIQDNDVITFMLGNERNSYLTHRVVGVIPNYNETGKPAFQTKGDANESADTFLVKPDQVIGKVVVGIPLLGGIVKFVGNNAVLVIVIVVLVVLLCVFLRALFDVNSKGKQSVKGDKGTEKERN